MTGWESQHIFEGAALTSVKKVLLTRRSPEFENGHLQEADLRATDRRNSNLWLVSESDRCRVLFCWLTLLEVHETS